MKDKMLTSSGLLVGFAFSASTVDEASVYIVNVCGHDSVGLPLARSMDAVDENYVEHHGIDNLIIPISVSEPKEIKNKEFSFCVDVVVHTLLLKKCVPTHHLYQHLTEKLLSLSIEWVLSECGVRLLPRTCRIVGNPFYFSETTSMPKSMNEIAKLAAELLQRKSSATPAGDSEKSSIPDALKLQKAEVQERKEPLIREIITTPAIKRGFLATGDARLYGPEGSIEGSAKPLDPLAHIPKSLRDKCQIIDTRNLEQSGKGPAIGAASISSDRKTSLPSRVGIDRASCCKGTDAEWSNHSFTQSDDRLIIRFAVPDSVSSLSDIELSAATDAIEINGSVTKLPVPILVNDVKAKYVKATRSLVVTCALNVK